MGLGNGSGGLWPIKGLKTEFEVFSALGIIFSTNYEKALNRTWENLYVKIKKQLGIMKGRYLNLYQKAIIINSLIASKLWYTSHVYPLPERISVLINTEIFCYIWGSYNSKPIKREVMYKSKDKGGIGLLNILKKSKSILASTVLKMYSCSDDSSLTKYYLKERFNVIIGIRNTQRNRRPIPKYYGYALDIIKKCINHRDFPNLSSKEIYLHLETLVLSNIEVKNPNHDWANIWKNISFRYIHVNDRPIIFKYVHGVIPTNKKLHQIRSRNDPICDRCDKEDTIRHKFYECEVMQECLNWLRRLIMYLCNMNTNQDSLIQMMSFDIPKVNVKVKNTLIIIISSYIACTWYNRHRLDFISNILKAKIIRDQKLYIKILGDKSKRTFTENYCKSNIEFICKL